MCIKACVYSFIVCIGVVLCTCMCACAGASKPIQNVFLITSTLLFWERESLSLMLSHWLNQLANERQGSSCFQSPGLRLQAYFLPSLAVSEDMNTAFYACVAGTILSLMRPGSVNKITICISVDSQEYSNKLVASLLLKLKAGSVNSCFMSWKYTQWVRSLTTITPQRGLISLDRLGTNNARKIGVPQ